MNWSYKNQLSNMNMNSQIMSTKIIIKDSTTIMNELCIIYFHLFIIYFHLIIYLNE